MDFQFYGANCIKITYKKTTVVIDDDLAAHGGKSIANAKDIVLITGATAAPKESYFIISSPGEYEVSDISIQGIPARSHMDEDKATSTTMYRLIIDGLRIGITGHVHPDLADSQLEALGTIDVLFVPVGGNGYTTDPVGAQRIIKEIEPKIVVPTHYDSAKLNFEVPQTPLDDAIKGLGMEVSETVTSLKPKGLEMIEGTRLVVVSEQ